MLTRSLLLRQIAKFCTKGPSSQPAEKVDQTFLTEAQKKQAMQIPVHLRPYDRYKFEVPMKKIKKNSGYAMIQIEPFPRARIMKICYNILADIKKDIPEDYIFRILIEEKTKFIMETVDRIDDVESLERIFGNLPIEIFIRSLADQFEVFNVVRKMKPWELSEDVKKEMEDNFMFDQAYLRTDRNPQYKKSERPKNTML